MATSPTSSSLAVRRLEEAGSVEVFRPGASLDDIAARVEAQVPLPA